jgi:hypothetical protein
VHVALDRLLSLQQRGLGVISLQSHGIEGDLQVSFLLANSIEALKTLYQTSVQPRACPDLGSERRDIARCHDKLNGEAGRTSVDVPTAFQSIKFRQSDVSPLMHTLGFMGKVCIHPLPP